MNTYNENTIGYLVSWLLGDDLRVGDWYPTLAECQVACDQANVEQRAADARRFARPVRSVLAADHAPEPGPIYRPIQDSE